MVNNIFMSTYSTVISVPISAITVLVPSRIFGAFVTIVKGASDNGPMSAVIFFNFDLFGMSATDKQTATTQGIISPIREDNSVSSNKDDGVLENRFSFI